MKAKLILSTIFLVASISLYAQDSSKLTKVFLQDGTTFSAYVEKQADGGYKLTTEDGSVLIYREGEISLDKPFKKSARNTQAKSSAQRKEIIQATNQVQSPQIPVQGLKYKDLKKMYSARDYNGREPGDKYSPVAVGIASFFVPGLGQYITGSQIGLGIIQSTLTGVAIPLVFIKALQASYFDSDGSFNYSTVFYTYQPSSLKRHISEAGQGGSVHFYTYQPTAIFVPAICVWAGMATWSAISASKAAKIKNLYYRDLKNQVTYKFDLSPYVDVTAPVFASNQNMVAGLSFRVSF